MTVWQQPDVQPGDRILDGHIVNETGSTPIQILIRREPDGKLKAFGYNRPFGLEPGTEMLFFDLPVDVLDGTPAQ